MNLYTIDNKFIEETHVLPLDFTGVIEYEDGTKVWCLNDIPHREDGPAVEHADGTKEYWLNGYLHNVNGPAIIYTNSTEFWYFKGELHKEDGPAIEYVDGTKEWYIHGYTCAESQYNLLIDLMKLKNTSNDNSRKTILCYAATSIL